MLTFFLKLFSDLRGQVVGQVIVWIFCFGTFIRHYTCPAPVFSLEKKVGMIGIISLDRLPSQYLSCFVLHFTQQSWENSNHFLREVEKMKLNNCVSAYNIFPSSSSGGKHSLIQDFQSQSLGGMGGGCCWENFTFDKFNCSSSDISFLLCIYSAPKIFLCL